MVIGFAVLLVLCNFAQKFPIHPHFLLIHHAAQHVLLDDVRLEANLGLLELAFDELRVALCLLPNSTLLFFLFRLSTLFPLAHFLNIIFTLFKLD
jgi:hypothetical protein